MVGRGGADGRLRIAHADRRGDAVHNLIVPLVEGRDLPVAGGNILEVEVAVGIALGEQELGAIRIAEADVALGERVGVVRAAAVETLVRRAAHAGGGDVALDFMRAIRSRLTVHNALPRSLMILGLAKPMVT